MFLSLANGNGKATYGNDDFAEHTIRDEVDWVGHINYLHYNPVKHGLVECPHQWEFFEFSGSL